MDETEGRDIAVHLAMQSATAQADDVAHHANATAAPEKDKKLRWKEELSDARKPFTPCEKPNGKMKPLWTDYMKTCFAGSTYKHCPAGKPYLVRSEGRYCCDAKKDTKVTCCKILPVVIHGIEQATLETEDVEALTPAYFTKYSRPMEFHAAMLNTYMPKCAKISPPLLQRSSAHVNLSEITE